jgi:hypothetical protein
MWSTNTVVLQSPFRIHITLSLTLSHQGSREEPQGDHKDHPYKRLVHAPTAIAKFLAPSLPKSTSLVYFPPPVNGVP